MMKRKSEKKEYEKHNSHMVCQTLMLLCIYNYLTWILSYSKSQHKSSITPLSK